MSWQTITKDKELDISVVKLTTCLTENRFDSEFYIPEYLDSDKKLERSQAITLNDYLNDIRYGLNVEPTYTDEGTKFLRALNLKEYGLEGEVLKIPLSVDKIGKKNLLQRGDLLIVRSGANVGDMGFVMSEDFENATFGSYVIRIRVNNISPYYLYVFLKSKYGRYQTIRYRSGAAQPNISIPNLKNLKIVKPNKGLQDEVEKLLFTSHRKRQNAGNVYFEAEQSLLKEINLAGYEPNKKNISVRSLTESLADNRFDAEYWQPDFDAIQNAIKKNKDGFDTLDKLFELSDKKVRIDPEKEYLYAELADVNSASGTIDNFTTLQGKELPSRGRMVLKKNDIIVSSVEGSLEKIALVLSEEKNIIGSTGFFVLRQKAYEPEVALVLLKSKQIQQLLKRQAQGTILTAIPKTSLPRVLLPKINQDLQGKIKEKIAQSNKERQEAKNQLEKAKRAVEIFIEQDEKQALAYLNQ